MDVKLLAPVDYHNIRVITTEQLAEAYECDPNHIRNNFKNNKKRFEEGKHYFRLTGEELRNFKNNYIKNFDSVGSNRIKIFDSVKNKNARSILLWTKRGASRHSKMLGTDRAWDVFDELEETYFNPAKRATVIEPPKRDLRAEIDRAQREYLQSEEYKEKKKLKDYLKRLVSTKITQPKPPKPTTIPEYACAHNIYIKDYATVQKLENRARWLSDEMNREVRTVYLFDYGTTYSFSVDVLEKLFSNVED